MPPEESPPDSPTPPRKRKWQRWLGVFFLLLITLLLWVNFSGASWFLERTLKKQLTEQGLSGDLKVEGQLTSGFTLTDLDFSGDEMITQLKAEELTVNYNLLDALNKEINLVRITSLQLSIDLDKAPESTEEQKESPPIGETLNEILPLIRPINLEVTDLRVEVKKGEHQGVIELASLTHAKDSPELLLTNLQTEFPQNQGSITESATLVWEEDLLTLDRLAVAKDARIANLRLSSPSQLTTDLFLTESAFEVESNLTTDHFIELKDDSLDLSKITQLIDPELPLTGNLTSLKIKANTEASSSNLDALIEAKNVRYDSITIPSAKLTASLIEKNLQLKLLTNTKLENDQTFNLTLDGGGPLSEEITETPLDFTWQLTSSDYPKIDGALKLRSSYINIEGQSLDTLSFKADLHHLEVYKAHLQSKGADLSEFHPLLKKGTFEILANGNLDSQVHEGSLTLDSLNLQQEETLTSLAGKAAWNWPESFSFSNLNAKQNGRTLTTALTWKNGFANISELTLTDQSGPLLTGSGSLPAPLDSKNLEELLASPEPLDFSLKIAPTSLSRIQESLSGTLNANLKIGGTFENPTINGALSAQKIRDSHAAQLPPCDLSLTLKTTDSKLNLTGSMTEPGGPLLDITGSLPFEVREWIEEPDAIAQTPIAFTAQSPEINLKRLLPFLPELKELSGAAKFDLDIKGKLEIPETSGSAKVRIDRARLSDSPISDFRDSELTLLFAENTITIPPSKVIAAGAPSTLAGTIVLEDDPQIDLTFRGDKTLIWRSSEYTLRANPNLKINGPLSAATISGEVPIVESLIYKDVEILPFGIPTRDIPEPEVPDFSSLDSGELYSLPEPFSNWPVDLKIFTKDPVLVQGNLVKGKLIANTRITGTLGNVRTSGTINTEDLTVDLPFSNLVVDSGVVTLNADQLIDPKISLRGTSNVADHNIQIYLGGSASNPKLTMTSEPPLPENEILLLLSTGSSSASLNNRTVASQKALQYLLEGLRRKYGKDGSRSVLQRFLKNSDEVNLSLGDYNRFSGRHFTSATIELDDEWAITTSVDNEGRTRAMVVFSIRFK